MELSRTAIAFTIEATREVAAMTIADLATATGISPQRLDRIESQEQDAAFADIAAIAIALDVNIDQLLFTAMTIQRHIEDQSHADKPLNPDMAQLKANLQALSEADKAALKADLQELHQVALKTAAYALASAARDK